MSGRTSYATTSSSPYQHSSQGSSSIGVGPQYTQEKGEVFPWYERPEPCEPAYPYFDEINRLRVNWFRLPSELQGKHIYEHEVKIFKRKMGKKGPEFMELKRRDELRSIFWKIVRMRRGDFSAVNKHIFDDYNSLWTDYQLLIGIPEVTVDVKIGREVYQMIIKFVASYNVNFCRKTHEQETIGNQSARFVKYLLTQRARYVGENEIDNRQRAFASRFAIDRSSIHYIPVAKDDPKVEVAPGISAWLGIYFGMRELQNYDPVVNFGLVHKLFYDPPALPLLEYFFLLVDNGSDPKTREANLRLLRERLDKNELTMTAEQRRRMSSLLCGVKVVCDDCVVESRGRLSFVQKHFTVVGISEQNRIPRNYRFTDKGRYMVDVYHHMGRPVRYPELPLVEVKSGQKNWFLPICKLKLHETPQRFKNRITEQMKQNMIKGSTLIPSEHKKKTLSFLNMLEFDVNPTETINFLDGFGLNMRTLEMLECDGNVLCVPSIVDGKGDKIPIKQGRTFSEKRLNVTCDKELCCALVVLKKKGSAQPCIEDGVVGKFHATLMEICAERGLRIGPSKIPENRSLLSLFSPISCFDGVENFEWLVPVIQNRFNNCKDKENKQLLIIVFTEQSDDAYGYVKMVCDNKFGIPCQVIRAETVMKTARTESKNVFYNIALKINGKLDGINQEIGWSEAAEMTLDEKEEVKAKTRRMYIGIDVTHPTAGSSINISIASIVGSINIGGTRYRNDVLAQMRPKETVEVFVEQFAKLFRSYFENTNTFPEHIVIFRDGVSDSEMRRTASIELNSLRAQLRDVMKSCNVDIEEPKFTYIVIQKRHTTRFYRVVEDKKQSEEDYANVKSGTVVDEVVVSPYKFDFWLASHHGELGTTRPSHYTVLYDDSAMKRQEVYKMCYELCFLSARCRKPVSLPVPVYYAHLVCEKAKEVYKCFMVQRGTKGSQEEIQEVLLASENYPGMHFV